MTTPENFIPFAPPRVDDAMIEAVVETLRSGWITTGPRTKAFEKELAEYMSAPSVLCLNSATAGLELMLRWFGVGDGDEVILPAYTYSATANVVTHTGATPVLVDCLADDFTIDPDKVRRAISPRTKVIMPVDFAGYPCHYEELWEVIAEAAPLFLPRNANQSKLGRVMLLADAAHSIGATYKGRRTGTLADASVFSFHAVKNLTTAEGGCVALNLPKPFDNEAEYKALCITSLHGQTKDALAKNQPGAWRYDIVEAGYKWNMPDILAAMGRVELARYDSDTLPVRRAIIARYDAHFQQEPWAILPPQTGDEVNGLATTQGCAHLYPLRVAGITETQRDAIIRRVAEQGISVNVHFLPIPMLSFYKDRGHRMADFPQAYANYACEISLTVFYDLTPAQQEQVCRALSEAVEGVLEKEYA